MKPGVAILKRTLDVGLSLAGILLLAPLMALIAILVKLDSPGPALYEDERMGRHGRPFIMYKFRSMYVGSPVRRNPDGSTCVAQNDPRVTRVGRILRLGFDELPQLFNILRGDMSLIGPRPDPPEALPHYRKADKKRLLVRPGITGLAQVSGRTDIPWRERLAYDLEYVERLSLWLDLKIAIFTIIELIPPLRRWRFGVRIEGRRDRMPIVDLTTDRIAGWKQSTIDQYAFPPYGWIRQVTAESRQALMSRELEQATDGDDQALLLGLVAAESLSGFAQAHRLEWDTNHFGVEIWRLDHLGAWGDPARQWEVAELLAQAIVQAVKQRGGRGIQARVPIDNLPAIHALESVGFRIVEVTTTWLFDLHRSTIPAKRHPDLIRDVQPKDAEGLINLARIAYEPTPDRFHSDPHLSSKASSELYAEWMRNSLSGALADHIAVADSDGQPVGYSTLRYLGDMDGRCNVRIGQMGLGAMLPAYRDRGLITDIVIHHLGWLQQRDGDLCIVGTQGNNIPAQRVFLKAGFKPATMSLSLHFWGDESSQGQAP